MSATARHGKRQAGAPPPLGHQLRPRARTGPSSQFKLPIGRAVSWPMSDELHEVDSEIQVRILALAASKWRAAVVLRWAPQLSARSPWLMQELMVELQRLRSLDQQLKALHEVPPGPVAAAAEPIYICNEPIYESGSAPPLRREAAGATACRRWRARGGLRKSGTVCTRMPHAACRCLAMASRGQLRLAETQAVDRQPTRSTTLALP